MVYYMAQNWLKALNNKICWKWWTPGQLHCNILWNQTWKKKKFLKYLICPKMLHVLTNYFINKKNFFYLTVLVSVFLGFIWKFDFTEEFTQDNYHSDGLIIWNLIILLPTECLSVSLFVKNLRLKCILPIRSQPLRKKVFLS